MKYSPFDGPWSETVPFRILFWLVNPKWTKSVQNHQKPLQASPCSETSRPIFMKPSPFDAPWSETVPFCVLFWLVHPKWTKSDQNHQQSLRTSPCSKTTGTIWIRPSPFDAPWSETVPFWILFWLVYPKWTKSVQNHPKPLQTSPCSETTEPILMKPSAFDAPWSETVPLWILFWLVHPKWTKSV